MTDRWLCDGCGAELAHIDERERLVFASGRRLVVPKIAAGITIIVACDGCAARNRWSGLPARPRNFEVKEGDNVPILSFNAHSGVYRFVTPEVKTRADALEAEVRRSDVPVGIRTDVELTIRQAASTAWLKSIDSSSGDSDLIG